jgi:hypothetical protein
VRIATWNVWCNCVETDVMIAKLKPGKRAQEIADWEKAIREAKVRS